jgi:hypothetical protein
MAHLESQFAAQRNPFRFNHAVKRSNYSDLGLQSVEALSLGAFRRQG